VKAAEFPGLGNMPQKKSNIEKDSKSPKHSGVASSSGRRIMCGCKDTCADGQCGCRKAKQMYDNRFHKASAGCKSI